MGRHASKVGPFGHDVAEPETFVNRTALFGWLFAAFYVAGLVAMTHVTVRDGAPPGSSSPMIIGLMSIMWIAGLGFAAYAATRPCVTARVSPAAGVLFTQRHPHKVVRRKLDAAKVRPATIVVDEDSEGSPYYFARVRSLDGGQWDIAEGHARHVVQRACDRFNRALTTAGFQPGLDNDARTAVS